MPFHPKNHPSDPHEIADIIRGVRNLPAAASCHEGLEPEDCLVLNVALAAADRVAPEAEMVAP